MTTCVLKNKMFCFLKIAFKKTFNLHNFCFYEIVLLTFQSYPMWANFFIVQRCAVLVLLLKHSNLLLLAHDCPSLPILLYTCLCSFLSMLTYANLWLHFLMSYYSALIPTISFSGTKISIRAQCYKLFASVIYECSC